MKQHYMIPAEAIEAVLDVDRLMGQGYSDSEACDCLGLEHARFQEWQYVLGITSRP